MATFRVTSMLFKETAEQLSAGIALSRPIFLNVARDAYDRKPSASMYSTTICRKHRYYRSYLSTIFPTALLEYARDTENWIPTVPHEAIEKYHVGYVRKINRGKARERREKERRIVGKVERFERIAVIAVGWYREEYRLVQPWRRQWQRILEFQARLGC